MRVLWSLVVLCLVAAGGVERAGERRSERVEEVLGTSPHELAARVGTHPTTSRLSEREPERSRALSLAIVIERFALAPQAVVALVERAATPAVVAASPTLVASARGPPSC